MSDPAWHEHGRWADVPRCGGCGQPLMHPESKRLGECFHCRTPDVNEQATTEESR